jgi:hypothetical protein
MEDFKFWAWIIVAVIYYIVRARNKAKKEAEERQANQSIPETTDTNKPPGRPLTFEELLREIQTGKATPQPEVSVPPPPPTYRKPEPAPWNGNYEDEPVEEIEDLETIPPQRREPVRETYDAYEKAKLEAFNRPSLEETTKLSDTDVKFGHFKSYDVPVQRNVLAEYISELKDPEGFRKAFVLSEILKRKF